MNKKILFFTLFILMILLCNNSYATNITLENANNSTCIDITNILLQNNTDYVGFDNYNIFVYRDRFYLELYFYTGDITFSFPDENTISFTTTGTFRVYECYNFSSSGFTYNSYYRANNTQTATFPVDSLNTYGINWYYCTQDIDFSSSPYASSYSFTQKNATTIDYIIYGIAPEEPEEPEDSEEPLQVDLSKISQDLDYIKTFLFYICLYLLCKAIYGVIWWLYNKTLL